jgi:DNA transformation protein
MAQTSHPVATDFSTLSNLGPKSNQLLQAAGIHTYDELCRLGAVRAYVRVKEGNANVSLNLLWALEGAISREHWQVVARERRTSLLMALDDAQRRA